MNKKFLSAIMFGALMTASTGVFVSCEDYGDDIAHLQEQIDQNAATADSELAAKVAALQSQLSTLEAAQESLKEQLATAKAEAATAANNALAAAQAAQAAADKAQGGADEAKTAAAAAQAAADKANQALSDAVARVAVLESKVASLEATIAELSAASKDLNAKLAEVQTLAAALKNSTDKNAADVAALSKQVADLNAELGKVSSTLGARIDAIDAQLNEIKATFDKYVTKSELQAKADVLANMDAQLQLQIQTNLNYIKEMQAAIASLGEKDKDLAAAIEKNYTDVMAEIEELATSQAEALATLEAAVKAGDAKLDEAIKAVQAIAEANAAAIKDIQATLATKADKTAVDALAKDLAQAMTDIADITADLAAYKAEVADELAGINASIEDLYALAAQIAQTAQGNYADIAALRELTAEQILNIEDMLAQLSQTVTTNYLYSVSIEEKLEDHLTVIYDQLAQLSQTVISNYKEVVKNKEDIYDLQVRIGNDEVRISDLEGIVSSLTSLAESNYELIVANQEEIETLKGELASTMTEIADWQKEFEGKYETLVTETQAKIDAELAKLTALSENINVLNADVAALQGQMDAVNALLNGLHSVVFVSQYTNTDFDLSVFHINTWVKNSRNEIVAGADVLPVSTAKFRVEPTGFAQKLADAYAKDNNILKIESANKLVQTRATEAKNLLDIKSVKAEGDFLYVGVSKKDDQISGDDTYPTVLVVANTDSTLSRTSDHFKVKFSTESEKNVINHLVQTGNGKGESFNGYEETSSNELNVLSNAEVKLYHNVFDAYNIKEALTTNLENADAAVALPYNGAIKSNLRIVSVDGVSLKDGKWSNTYFTVKENGEVTVNSGKDGLAIPSNVGQSITVRVVDDTYQLFNDGNAYVAYDIKFIIVENCYENTLTFNFAMEWPETADEAKEITLGSIAADAAKLNKYKLTAADVFESLCNAVTTSGVTYSHADGYGITMVYVPETSNKEAHITVTPFTSLTMNYNKDVNGWAAADFKDDALCSKIYIKVNYDLSIPGVTDFFNKVKMYWGGEDDNTLEVDYTLQEAETKSEYTYTVDMNKVYIFNDWTPGVVDYAWTIDKADDVDRYTNIAFSSNGVLEINGPISVVYKNGNKELVDVDDLTFTATASNNGNVLAQTPDQKFNVTYPINVDEIQKPDKVVFKYSDLKAGKKFDATSSVSLKDIDGYTWIYEGVILDDATAAAVGLTSVQQAWKISDLKYEVIDVTSAGQDLTAENLITIAPEGGELVINKPANITKPAYVTIKMTFSYKYEKNLSTTYTVIVDPTL